MATKKLTPVAPAGAKKETKVDVNQQILEELKKQTEYMHRTDWKLWMLMNVVKNIAEENGYTITIKEDTYE
jgi:hypothetical protein